MTEERELKDTLDAVYDVVTAQMASYFIVVLPSMTC